MFYRTLLFVFALLLPFFLGPSGTARAQAAKATAAASAPRTVLDFYLRLPREAYFEVKTDRERIALTKRAGGILDLQNGYLRAIGNAEPDFQDNLTMCLFKRTDKTYLAAVSAHAFNEGDYQANLEFWEWKNGKIRPVKKSDVLPLPFNDALDYPLPRKGTTIHVATPGGDNPVYDLVWTGAKFRVQKPAPVPKPQ